MVLDLVGPGLTRLAVDGAPTEEAHALGAAVAQAHGRAVHVRAEGFWRPAGQRFEHGRDDVDDWLHLWLDESALDREVLRRALEHGEVVPAIRDPVTERSVRAVPVPVPEGGLVVVSGSALLGRGLPFDVTVHLQASAAALARRLPDGQQWLVEALQRYDEERAPAEGADLVVRVEDPRHPALVHPSR
nr:hypothetical protein Hi04_10k_c2835_00009 [uncultured bacterium]